MTLPFPCIAASRIGRALCLLVHMCVSIAFVCWIAPSCPPLHAVALGYTVPLYRAIVNNDVDFAVSTAYYHLVVALFGTFLVMTGGTATKVRTTSAPAAGC